MLRRLQQNGVYIVQLLLCATAIFEYLPVCSDLRLRSVCTVRAFLSSPLNLHAHLTFSLRAFWRYAAFAFVMSVLLYQYIAWVHVCNSFRLPWLKLRVRLVTQLCA